MTAVTVVEAYNHSALTGEGYLKTAYCTGEPNVTYTPSNSSGKTIRIVSCYSASGTAVEATVTAGVITFGAGSGGNVANGEGFVVTYTLT